MILTRELAEWCRKRWTHTQQNERGHCFNIKRLGYIGKIFGFDLHSPRRMEGNVDGMKKRRRFVSIGALHRRSNDDTRKLKLTLRKIIDGNFPAAVSTSLLNAAHGSAHGAQKLMHETRLRSCDRRSLKCSGEVTSTTLSDILLW